jgi:hypothetical protein
MPSVPKTPAPTPKPERPIDGPSLELGRLVEVLDRHGVEYLLVGGSAAGAHGAERPTEDADCVVRRERGNLDRLAGALRELNARLRVDGMTDAEARTLPVRIDGTVLDMAGMSTWMTDAGPFDVLAGLVAADGRLVPYEELAERAVSFQGDGFVLRTAGIDDIIAAKERAGRPKDREAMPELREIQAREHREAADADPSGPRPPGSAARPDPPAGGGP